MSMRKVDMVTNQKRVGIYGGSKKNSGTSSSILYNGNISAQDALKYLKENPLATNPVLYTNAGSFDNISGVVHFGADPLEFIVLTQSQVDTWNTGKVRDPRKLGGVERTLYNPNSAYIFQTDGNFTLGVTEYENIQGTQDGATSVSASLVNANRISVGPTNNSFIVYTALDEYNRPNGLALQNDPIRCADCAIDQAVGTNLGVSSGTLTLYLNGNKISSQEIIPTDQLISVDLISTQYIMVLDPTRGNGYAVEGLYPVEPAQSVLLTRPNGGKLQSLNFPTELGFCPPTLAEMNEASQAATAHKEFRTSSGRAPLSRAR